MNLPVDLEKIVDVWQRRIPKAVWSGVAICTLGCAPTVTSSEPENRRERVDSNQIQEVTSNSDSVGFTLEHSSKLQVLEFVEIEESRIQFALESDLPCTRLESGVAVLSDLDGDLEIRTGPDEEGFPVDQYMFDGEGSCVLIVNVALGDRSYAWIDELDCHSSCPFDSGYMTLN